MRWSSRQGDGQLKMSSPGPEAYTTCVDVNCPVAKISRSSSRHEGFHEGFHEPHPSSWSPWTPRSSGCSAQNDRPSVLHLVGRGNRRDDVTTTPISPTSMVRPSESGPPSSLSGMDALIEAAVERAIGRSLGPHLSRLSVCEPAVYTVAQAAEVLQVSEDTVGRIVRRGVLPRVPHVGGKILIPRRALDRLIESAEASPEKASVRADPPIGTPLRRRSNRSVAS
jgi:excisionase family DNA binding protein